MPLAPQTVRFGPFGLDLRAAELHLNGKTIKLPEQPFQVLTALLEHPGEVVTREELRQRLWRSDTFVDFEHSLNAAVKRLREMLGDSAESPRYIETLPRHGYRLIAPVEGPKLAVPDAQIRPPKTLLRVLAIAAGVVILIMLGSWRWSRLQALLGRAHPARVESLAVLPLVNLSGSPDEEYFADGMTEQLITELGKVHTLRVISRQSVMQYKGTNKPVPQIARELHVEAVVEGSALRVGDKVRITTQLIQVNPERHLWSESYERDLRDILALQSEVAQAITNEVKIKLTPQEQTRLASTRPVNPEAYQALLRAKSEKDSQKAFAYLQQAIALDPTYAPAYVELADYYIGETYSGRPVKEAVPLARAAVDKALELDPTLAEAHAKLGYIKFWFDWDWSGAEADLKRTVMLNPNNAYAHLAYGAFLNHVGRSGEAVREFQKEQELNPLDSGFALAFGLFYARRYDESIAQFNKVLEKKPDFALANAALAWNYVQKRMYPEAVAVCRRVASIAPEDQVMLGGCGWVYAHAGRRQDALALLDRLKKRSRLHLDPYAVAFLYDGLGDDDRTMEWLERAYRERSPNLAFLKIEFWSDSLRSDPRFQGLVRRMNFPP
ncbi:MAG: winged helix-turn-helix domain-containing protein [Acidobacteriia bacterium]|nr:winged helix-turn-helix domain-containing protein [Terriglobia bacterium]